MATREKQCLHNRLRWNNKSTRNTSDITTRPQQYSWISKVAICSLCGMAFGFALEKGRVFEPHIIRGQMLFTNFTMLKMFLSASATSMLSFSLLTMIPATRSKMEHAVEEFTKSLNFITLTGTALGGIVLGCGMTLSGACPGMVLAQVGAAVPNSVLTMVGGLCGAFLYSLSDPFLPILIRAKRVEYHETLDEFMETPYFILALPFAAILGMFVFGFELIFPWTSQVEVSGSGWLASRAWPPFVTGALIGLLQIPVVLSVEDTLGSSTSYVTVASQFLFIKPLQRWFTYLKPYRRGILSWWQVCYVGGAILGSHLSARSSDTLGSVQGLGPWASLCGGAMMLYGSRLAGGCTSGHGLTGMGLLAIVSFVAVPAMFAGGITFAFAMKHVIGVDM